jgi:uncharacterized radical SAM superfamily Fe-S cluster-containing enzyme
MKSDALFSGKYGEVIGKTRSICPECLTPIDAEIVKKDERILLVKVCGEHGVFVDTYFSSAEDYQRFSRYGHLGDGLDNPNTSATKGCPLDCGLCENHKSATVLANIDLTNRCNLSCPICFATAEKSGYLYEPSLEQIGMMLRRLREEKPLPCFAVQFAGGEPTLREDLPEIIEMAIAMGFSYVQLATNGMKFARSEEYCRKIRKTSLATVYLQFDGITPEPYLKTRGFNALPYKLKAIENMRKTGLNNVVLVPTLVKGVNDGQVADIIDFGLKNIDIVRGVNFQPVSFTGRIDRSKLKEERITIPDFLELVEKQTGGAIKKSDFYTVPSMEPISRLIEAWTGEPQVKLTCHPHCGCATYVLYDKGEVLPITKLIDVDGLLNTLDSLGQEARKPGFSRINMIKKLLVDTPRHIKRLDVPVNVDIVNLLKKFIAGDYAGALCEFHNNAFFIGAMHFQDPYNLDLERLQRCAIHYATPDGRIIPFCSYNIFYRDAVQRKFAEEKVRHESDTYKPS